MVKAESCLGRSTVIDLTTSNANKFRQVDHRSINYIILNNCKYVLKKGAKKTADDEAEVNKDAPKWDVSKLAVGDTFSGTNYFRMVQDDGSVVQTKSSGQAITVSKDILQCQMYNASAFEKEEKLSLTKVAELLESANTACFTVCFRTKVDESLVREKLRAISAADFKDKAKLKTVSKELIEGNECVLVGRLSKAAGKLGRSLIVDLPTQGYRQVDHRTLKWLIIKNVKYTVGR